MGDNSIKVAIKAVSNGGDLWPLQHLGIDVPRSNQASNGQPLFAPKKRQNWISFNWQFHFSLDLVNTSQLRGRSKGKGLGRPAGLQYYHVKGRALCPAASLKYISEIIAVVTCRFPARCGQLRRQEIIPSTTRTCGRDRPGTARNSNAHIFDCFHVRVIIRG